MPYRKKCFFISIFLLLQVLQISLNAKVFPDILPGTFIPNAENIYCSIENAPALPSVIFERDKPKQVTGGGFSLRFETGYDWDGWLIGLRCGPTLYFPNESLDSKINFFNHMMLGGQISKVIGQHIIPAFPQWLSFSPSLGCGVSFINTEYYQRDYDTDFHQISGSAFYISTGVNFNFYFDKRFGVPYVGTELYFMPDVGGLTFMPVIQGGVRVYPFGFAALKKGSLDINTICFPETFSPDNDGQDDTLTLRLYTFSTSPVKNWEVKIFDEYKQLFMTFKGRGHPPKYIHWNGLNENGEMIQAASNYTYTFNAVNYRKLTDTCEGKFSTDIFLIRNEENIKIATATIKFDPNRATFATLTWDENNRNSLVLNKIVTALKKFPDYKISVEGHANNISNTEAEERRILIPLSKYRADVIKKMLIERGIDKDRITTVGRGGKFPIVPREKREEWWKNRRVEFILTK